MLRLAILVSAVLVLSHGHTDRETESQTRMIAVLTYATTVDVNKERRRVSVSL